MEGCGSWGHGHGAMLWQKRRAVHFAIPMSAPTARTTGELKHKWGETHTITQTTTTWSGCLGTSSHPLHPPLARPPAYKLTDRSPGPTDQDPKTAHDQPAPTTGPGEDLVKPARHQRVHLQYGPGRAADLLHTAGLTRA